ncbi:MAG TPA: virulence factor BrkB family protein [Alphaproteobacteria bacterium]|nr:virulence factor BrkB family protein [Alphaproteobacteria bacterium]
MTEEQPGKDGPPARTIVDGGGIATTARNIGSIALYTWRRLVADRCLSVAASLSYTTLLSIVPLVAVGLAAFAAFPVFEGVQETLQKFLFQNFVPAASEVVREQITKFVANTGQLTAIGIIILVITALMLLSTIEEAFNVIWRQSESRSFGVRFLTYWAILTLTPLLIGGSFAVSSYIFAATEVMNLEVLKGPLGFLLRLLPFLLSVIAFALIYIVMPNRRVDWRHALAGALTAAVLFQLLKLVFVLYVTNFPSFETIYGAVAAMPLFLVWMYVTWVAVLVGAELAAAIPEWRLHRSRAQRVTLKPAEALALALGLLAAARAGQAAGTAYVEEDLAEAAGSDLDRAAPLIDKLVAARFLARAKDDKLLVARDLRSTTLYDLAAALGLNVAPGGGADGDAPAWARRLHDLIASNDAAMRAALSADLQALIDGGAAQS